jgi:serine/threonine-protein kinase
MRSGVPVVLDRILLKALAKSPAERYQHVADMLVDLRSVQRELESSASEPLAPTPGPAGPTATDAERIRSLAVLPFSDMSPEKDQQYFCDGIAEELITSLAKIRDLQVAARTSAFAFKGSTADIREIGRTLNVQAVVEGSVRKAGAKLRIGVQLVGVADGYPLWTGRYDRDAADIFAVQDDVAAAIIDQLKLTLLPEERQGVFARRTDSLQAHSLYLEGLNYLWMYSSLGFYEAIRRFEHALRIDPNYAQAYWGLSAAHTQVAFWGVTPPREACQKVKHYAQRALALDPMLSDAHGALSYVHLFYDWDMAAAEREALEAIRLGPNSSVAHSYYAFYLLHAGRPWEAVKEALKAQSLDPVSSFLAFVVGLAFGNTGDFPRAIEELQSGLRLNGDFYILYNFLGLTYFANGEYEASVQAHQQAVNLSRRLPYFVSSLAAALHLSGRRSEADALWSELRRRAQSEYVRPCCFVQMHAGRGDLRQVSTWLKRAGEERDSYLPWMKLLPANYIQGHTESRWKARLRKALFNFVVQRTMDRNRSVSAH